MSRSVCLCVIACLAVGLFTKSAQAGSCWSSWSNTMAPSDANNRTDRERVPKNDTTLQTDCSSNYGVQCTDNGGEPITGSNMNKTTSHYVVSCDMTHGLTCTPYANFKAKNYTCPDFSLRVGCDCPTTPGVSTTTIAATKAPTGSGGGNPAGAKTGGNGNGNGRNSGTEKTTTSIIYLVVAVSTLFVRA